MRLPGVAVKCLALSTFFQQLFALGQLNSETTIGVIVNACDIFAGINAGVVFRFSEPIIHDYWRDLIRPRCI
jgi:hypothetical protein